ncbi:sigma-70 family RNA polymerase sigma factor [Novosphingobium sp. TCA1]|uniref:Sigma-70 family RNA polymerase sigma factor n=1 Tax=Sphingobium yanoikuyae TaxID=13690 RepID=A0A3G2UKX6_SPHYA|nr:sigma-70 family RNA polymerase sigma factor [Novosphingobium sp. TCA1]AYO75716.1 sigma-70 family RNA polymerase sigma factor [Sphingobium yanoikuyae]
MSDLMPRLASYARSLARNSDTAQDLVQETLLKAWRHRASFEPGTNLKAWTFRILRNSFLSQVRRRGAGYASETAELIDIPVASNQESVVTLSDVRRLWSRLTPEQQRCIQLIGIQGLSYEETATIEQVPVGTIKSRVLRGRQLLRELLDQTNTGKHFKSETQIVPTDTIREAEPTIIDEVHNRQIELLQSWRTKRAADRCSVG